MPARLAFFDAAGRRWNVFDAVIVDENKLRAVHLGEREAKVRVFRLEGSREQRVYAFAPDEPHSVSERSLERHFLEARSIERAKLAMGDLSSR